MASREPSPKRQRLSPPGDDSPSFATTSGADSAYGSTTASQVNGVLSNTGASTISASGSSQAPFTQNATVKLESIPETSPTIKAEDMEMQDMANEDHRRTDHERKDGDNPSALENFPLLCKKSHPLSRPHPTQNLVNLYSLSDLASSVARRDPVTGAKINKLRKSYEGKVKKQSLPGRNKPTVLEGELMGLMEWADEAWYDQKIYGRELENALDPLKGRLWRSEEGSAATKIDRALQLNPGRLPRDEDQTWRATLALDEPASAQPKAAPPKPTALSAVNGLKPGLTTGMRASAPASPAARSPGAVDRPDRAGKKRRYNDQTFEGYAESGWAEDDGYSTGGDAAKRGKRRRVSVGVS
ncbi:Rox3-domain-containing protein [Myriangium duriaei CBS 260.36]|uniref:Mediator of RNA polymerase II transcription subunit 19 n=1 Tax=Myriangium duriaei CBS 260.36 TaxID=1168546 RepID=A0A9P4MHF1_9PEZI|nr:Rox3-domain-containing protein [Myriangium duriaei CBS 260.36]